MGRTASRSGLRAYRSKRDFERTAEPSGAQGVAASARARFVIHKHDATRLHFDLRLELDGVFKSWAVTKVPSLDPSVKRLAVEVEDHPLAYGDFEGTIPKGEYGGGTVQIWDRGYWSPRPGVDANEALRRGVLEFTLAGERLHGAWALVRMQPREKEKRDSWLLIKQRDEHASATDELGEADASVASGRSLEEIAGHRGRKPRPFMLRKEKRDGTSSRAARTRKTVTRETQSRGTQRRMPEFIEPQLCKLVSRAPSGEGWAHEVKLDGYRMQLRVEGGRATLRTRRGLDWTARFAAIAASARKLPDSIIDGEICAIDRDGTTDFAALQAALADEHTDELILFAFDLLRLDGRDLRTEPLAERKAALAKLMRARPPNLRYVEHFESPGETVLKAACKMALEGIISKRLDAPYRSGRGDTWTKTKCRGGEEVVIGGWIEEQGRLRSLLVGARRGDHLVYLGKVGTGFGHEAVGRLVPRLKGVAATASPFSGDNAPKARANVR